MAINFKRPKIIADPLLGIIDVTDIIPLLDVEPFQSLGFKYQLGLAFSVFPSATHTRKQHCLGSYERTRRLAELWEGYGFITKEDVRNLPICALYHDIGHGPFSHVTEGLGSVNHNERGRQIVEGLRDVVESAGYDHDFVLGCFSRENPLYQAVSDKNLGTEKLDYLERDAFYTLGESPGVEYIAYHTYLIDGRVVVHEVALDQAKDIQEFYIKMYKNVYIRKKSAIIQRLVQKITTFLMQDGLDEKKLFEMTDFDLLGQFGLSKNPEVRFYYDNFKKGNFPKLAVEFKYEDIVGDPTSGSKPIHMVGLEESIFDRIVSSDHFQQAPFLDEVEQRIAEVTGVPRRAVVVVPPISRERFEPKEIGVYTHGGNVRNISEIYPSHFRAMQEYGRSYFSVRITAYEPHRRALYDKVDAITDVIRSLDA